MIKLDYASFTDALGNKLPLKTGDFVNFVRVNPGWESQTASTPNQLVRLTNTDWMMFPTPDAAHLNLSMNLMGTTIPAPATAAGETPPVSITLHPCYISFVAWRAFMFLNNPIAAQQQYAIYDGLRKLNLKAATSTTGSQSKFTMNM